MFPLSTGIAMNAFEPKRCSRMLRILAEPERLRIIQCLSDGPKNVGEIAEILGKHVVKISHHLSVLRQADLVEDERQGRFVIYRLHPNFYQPADKAEDSDHLNLGCCRLEVPKE
jgi:DNA-binding transcriptional ArsR family regulator